MKKNTVLIVEGECLIAEDLTVTLIELGYDVIGVVDSYDSAVGMLCTNQPDISIIDVKLNGSKTGIELGIHIREYYDFPFIYLSRDADSKTVHEASKTVPDAYLLKPFRELEIYSAIEVAIHTFSHKLTTKSEKDENVVIKDSIFIKKDSRFIKIMLDKIIYIKAEGNYLELMVDGDQKFLIRYSLKGFMSQLPDNNFLRVHNSYAINVDYIESVGYVYVIVAGSKIPISKNRRELIMRRMNVFS